MSAYDGQGWPLPDGVSEKITLTLSECTIGMPYSDFIKKLMPYTRSGPSDESGPTHGMRGCIQLLDGRKVSYSYDATQQDWPISHMYYVGYKKE